MVALNEKMEVLSQSLTLFANEVQKLIDKIEAESIERRSDMKFVKEFKGVSQDFRNDLKRYGESTENIRHNLSILNETLSDTEKSIRIKQDEDPVDHLKKLNIINCFLNCIEDITNDNFPESESITPTFIQHLEELSHKYSRFSESTKRSGNVQIYD
ncbi:hypothetical protein JTB14_024375 [Gonioctena quinquepunctata]|nr:hypothetical protein JTB14_024375 [Gonioctena quinquepunctata]